MKHLQRGHSCRSDTSSFYSQCITHLKITRRTPLLTLPGSNSFFYFSSKSHLIAFADLLNNPFALICHIIYSLGTFIHIQLSIQTSKCSKKDNIFDTKCSENFKNFNFLTVTLVISKLSYQVILLVVQ